MNNNFPPIAFFVIGFLCGFFLLLFLLGTSPSRISKEEAVEQGAAYWCIEDHEKVFSWDKCDN